MTPFQDIGSSDNLAVEWSSGCGFVGEICTDERAEARIRWLSEIPAIAFGADELPQIV